MSPALHRLGRFTSFAAPTLRAAAALPLLFNVAHAQDTSPQQPPAPVVRVRPRPQTTVPGTAPSDAAPLVNRTPRPRNTVPTTAPADAAPLVSRPPRPHPVNPQALSGLASTPASAADTPTRPRPAQNAAPAAALGATGQSSTPQTTTIPKPRSASAPVTNASQASGAAEHPTTRPATLSAVLNRNIIVLDPAHGGPDSGSRIGDNLLEKDVDLAFAFRLRSLLTARGFTVVLTRDSDAALNPPTSASSTTPGTPLTLDDRAGIANHPRPAACLLLHATGRGTGVHLYTSALDPTYTEPALLPWLTAQSSWVPASQQLERSLSSALNRSHVNLVSSTASIRPVDSLTCPAMVLELAPEHADPRSISDAGYQDRIASAIAGALVFWQNQVQPPAKLTATPPTTHTPARHRASSPTQAASPEAQP